VPFILAVLECKGKKMREVAALNTTMQEVTNFGGKMQEKLVGCPHSLGCMVEFLRNFAS